MIRVVDHVSVTYRRVSYAHRCVSMLSSSDACGGFRGERDVSTDRVYRDVSEACIVMYHAPSRITSVSARISGVSNVCQRCVFSVGDECERIHVSTCIYIVSRDCIGHHRYGRHRQAQTRGVRGVVTS